MEKTINVPDNEEIKRAVKEALDDKRMVDIAQQLTDLSTQMTKGFAEVHTRQDTTNGKVLKNTADIEKINDRQDSRSMYNNITWLLITTLVGVVVYFVTHN